MEMKAEEEEGRKAKSSWERVLLLAACRKRGGGSPSSSSTTPVMSWKKQVGASSAIIKARHFSSFSLSSTSHPRVSARKLAAALWEFHHYFSSATMYLGLGVNDPQRIRRRISRLNKDEGIDQPESGGSLRRHIAASLMRHHHQSAERNHHAMQPLSPASYSSSLEMAPYNPAATPDSSIQLKKRIDDPNYGFKTSTELLKVLNRIWSLEEQHASNTALVKALKSELDQSRARMKSLLRDQHANRHDIDELMKQLSENELARKNKDQERIDATLKSVRDELEQERKLRKRSESLHRKLARELFEIKVALSTTAKELETKRKSSVLLEGLCDEFAKGIREYARQLHTTKQRSDEDWTVTAHHHNLLLHISESWLDERMQVKDKQVQGSEKTSIVDKLRHEIEAFISPHTSMYPRDPKEVRARRRSLESIPEASTPPPPCIRHEDKAGPSNYEEQEELTLSERRKGQTPPSLQISDHQSTQQETDMLQMSDIYDSMEGTRQRKRAYVNEEGHGSNSKSVDKLMSELLLSEGNFPPESEYKGLRRNASPVRQWMTSMDSSDSKLSRSSSKMPPVRHNTLKAKLQEPKTKGQRSRLKILKSSS